MRFTFILSFLFTSLIAVCQIISLENPVIKGRVGFIIERSNKHKNYRTEYSFDSLSRLVMTQSVLDKKTLETISYNYNMIDDSVMIVTEIHKNTNLMNMCSSKYYYDSQKRVIRYEWYYENSLTPEIVELNVKYENSRIMQYDRILINNNDTTVIENYRFEYLNKKITIKKTDNKQISWETIIIKLDKKGNWIDIVVDYNNPQIFLDGVMCYSRFRHDKYKIRYKYDKMGNWTQSYFVTRFWRYKNNKREIRYN